jgi:hypothetical protein
VSRRPRGLALAGVVVAAVVAFAGWAAFLTAVARHIRYGSSDNANAVLAGQAMLHGNPLLRGWRMPHNSYWLLDLPLFGLSSAVFGLRDGLMAAVPAAIATASIGIGSVLAIAGRSTAKRWWAGAAVLAIVLGLPHEHLGLFLLQGPHHVATAVGCLVVFALLRGAGFGGVRWAAATVVLAAVVQSDPMAIAVGVVPIAAAGVVDAIRTRRLAALPGPVAAAALGSIGAVLLGSLLRLADGYIALPDPPALAAWQENLRAVPRILGGLLGVTNGGGLSGGGLSGAARSAHIAGAILLAAAVVASAVRSIAGFAERRPAASSAVRAAAVSARWLDDVLLVGCAGGIAVFVLLTDPALQIVNARYLLPPIIFAAVLAARRAVEVAARLPAVPVGAGVLALAAVYVISPLATLRAPAPENPSVAVADWLAGQGLDLGFGQYWVAGLTTVSGRGRVTVRPVREVAGTLQANVHFASAGWFTGSRPFRFVVVDRDHPDGVDEAVAAATFGPPAEGHDIGPYRVLIWDRDLAVRPDR